MGTAPSTGGDSFEWRVALLDQLLRWALGLGTIAFLVSAPALVGDRQYALLAVDAAVLGVFLVLLFARSIEHHFRVVAFLLLVASLGVALLLTVGLAGQLFLVGVPVLATVLLGQRTAVVVLVVTIGLFAATLGLNRDTLSGLIGDGAIAWIASMINFVLVAGLLTYAAGHLIARLERSLADQRRATQDAARLAAAVEQSTDSVLLVDADGLVVHANPAHRRLIGRIGPEARIVMLDTLLDRIERWGERPRGGSAGAVGEWSGLAVLLDVEGVEHRFEVRSSPLRDDVGEVVGAAVGLHDISERSRLEDQLRRSERLESLGTFASGVAHDFNNVMAGVRLLAETIGARTEDPEVIGHVGTIVGACDRVGVTVQQMLVFGRQGTPERCPIVLGEAVTDALVLVRAVLPPGVDLVVDLADSSRITANPAEIQQIVMNLATNAVHAMTIDGRALGVLAFEQRRVTLADGSAAAELVVTDTGSGIRAEHLPRLFDPFFTTKAAGEGSGMGLASVHGIVTGLGGSITVASEPGRGTEFRIQLPISVEEPAASDRSPTPVPAEGASVTPRGALRILLVDDEAPIRSAASSYLRRHGHEVTVAEDGMVGLELFGVDPSAFDLVITDVTMPGLDGPMLIRRMRAVRPGVPVLISTGFGEADRRFDTGGPVPVLQKPYSFVDLLTAIDRAMELASAG